jgi:hypothetical protein
MKETFEPWQIVESFDLTLVCLDNFKIENNRGAGSVSDIPFYVGPAPAPNFIDHRIADQSHPSRP